MNEPPLDIGSRHDHSVGIVLDVTEEVFDVACYVRLQGDYPQIQEAIEDLHTAFTRSSFTVIENNSSGAAVADNLTAHARSTPRQGQALVCRHPVVAHFQRSSAATCHTSAL